MKVDPKIFEKIKKCLRLAQSSNANEAAAAMRQAQKLMAMHGITAEDVDISDVETLKVAAGAGVTPPNYIAMLANMVARAFGAKLVYHQVKITWGRWSGAVEFYGLNGAAEVSGYAFEVLGRQLRRDRETYLKTLNKRLKRSTKTRRGDLYAEGWLSAVSRQITPHSPTDAEKKTLDAYKANRWPEPLKATPGRSAPGRRHYNDDAAMSQGFRDGEKVQFHQGVHAGKQARIAEAKRS